MGIESELAKKIVKLVKDAKLKGESEWKTYGEGQSFNVPGNSSFEIACDEPYHYVCYFC